MIILKNENILNSFKIRNRKKNGAKFKKVWQWAISGKRTQPFFEKGTVVTFSTLKVEHVSER